MTPLELKLVKTIPLSVYLRTKYGLEYREVRRHTDACPIHKEKKGKSFTFADDSSKWRCFGKCHKGGNVVDLHMASSNITDREEAIRSLQIMFSVNGDVTGFSLLTMQRLNLEDVSARTKFRKNIREASTIEEYLALDYMMSFSISDEEREEIKKNTLLRYMEPDYFSTKTLEPEEVVFT